MNSKSSEYRKKYYSSKKGKYVNRKNSMMHYYNVNNDIAAIIVDQNEALKELKNTLPAHKYKEKRNELLAIRKKIVDEYHKEQSLNDPNTPTTDDENS